MKFQLATKPLSEVSNEYLVLPIFEGGKSLFNNSVADFLTDNPKFGKLNETQLLYSKKRKLLLIGAGKKDKFDFQTLQNWAGTATKELISKTKSASFLIPDAPGLTSEDVAQAVVIGAEIAFYDPARNYKSDKEEAKLATVELIVQRAERGYQTGLEEGLIIAEGINLVRKLGDMPANEMTPTYFLNEAKKITKDQKLKITVLDEAQAKKKGMGAFVGVAQGSDEPSYMIALEYLGNPKSKDKWGIVGKGITFDTGGISIKPSSKMDEMKYDMVGAASALATVMAIAKLGLKTNVVAVMAVTENFPSGRAQRPGDIVKTYSGKSVEVLNTDAEGRLVLIDAISYAQKDFKATKLIDLATLTGAIVVALGGIYTGAFGNDPKFTQNLISAGSKIGEKIWEMPMDDAYDEMIKGDFADISNIGHGGPGWSKGAAGPITAAKFIEAGVKKNCPWIHLDIAGTAWDMSSTSFRSKGATGVGVKTLLKLISQS